MTVETGQATLPLDPQASLRNEMLGQIVAAQFALESAIAELMQAGGDPAIIAETRMQMPGLAELRQQVAVSSGSALISLRADINAASGASASAAQQARVAATNAASSMAADAIKRAEARQAIMSIGQDVFEQKVFDSYLRFSSAEDEAAYRKRERENKEAMDRESAKGTLQGDRNAAAILERQILDAGAHGANASPDYAPMLTQVRDAKAVLMQPVQQASAKSATQDAGRAPDASARPQPLASELDDVLATLKAAGVTTDAGVGQGGHGLTDNKHPARGAAAPPVRG